MAVAPRHIGAALRVPGAHAGVAAHQAEPLPEAHLRQPQTAGCQRPKADLQAAGAAREGSDTTCCRTSRVKLNSTSASPPPLLAPA